MKSNQKQLDFYVELVRQNSVFSINLATSESRWLFNVYRLNDRIVLWMKQKDNETATYAFYTIGNYLMDESFDSSGITVFDDSATDKHSFLSNSKEIYKDRVNKNRDRTFLI